MRAEEFNEWNKKCHKEHLQWSEQTEDRRSELEDRNFEITLLEAKKKRERKKERVGGEEGRPKKANMIYRTPSKGQIWK